MTSDAQRAESGGPATSPREEIDRLIASLPDWRGATLGRVRSLILSAEAGIEEDWKWRGSPVWSKAGLIAVGNAHKDKVKLTFSHGASLADPAGLFNNGFGGKVWRAIDLYEGDLIDEDALRDLVRAAVSFNLAKSGRKKSSARK
jgi:hypothetical protein